MKKLEYITPEMEVLDGELGYILCVSNNINRGTDSEDPEYEDEEIIPAGPEQKP